MSLYSLDQAPLFSSSSSRRVPGSTQDGPNEVDSTFISKTFKDFILNFRLGTLDFIYRDKLLSNINIGNHSLEINIEHINQYNHQLYELLSKDPSNSINIFEKVAIEIYNDRNIDKKAENLLDSIQIMIVSSINPLGIRDLQSKYMNNIIKIEGIVLSMSSLRSKAISISLQCKGCRNKLPNIRVPNGIESYPLPKKCPFEQVGNEPCPYDPFFILPDQSKCIDSQLCTIQESPQTVPYGEIPRNIEIYLDRNLCDKIKPGNYVLITGIFSIKNNVTKDRSGGAVGLRSSYIRAIGIEMLNNGIVQSIASSLSAEEELLFKRLGMRSDIYDVLLRSIAPSIYGLEDVKKSIICMLFGGSRKCMPDSLLRRGDINLLLLGDPGTAKSQLLKFVEKCAPIGIYTSGRGSSAAGLTASVVRDGQTRGFTIEGGAMVLGDGGVVCIDEFDKMKEDDRVAIHEAMEQQTISIAKAGITATLNSRCSVFAAANSVYGKWDDTKGDKNIDMMPTILSRFDMIYILKDTYNDQKDSTLANHVVDIHASEKASDNPSDKLLLTMSNVDTIPELSIETLRKYISYCKSTCGPRLSEGAAAKLQEEYVRMRNVGSSGEDNKSSKSKKPKKVIPITVRQLEALIRTSEALAKMRLSPFTSEADVTEAIRLFTASTLTSAQTGALAGIEGMTSTDDQGLLIKAESQLKKRFIPGSQVAINSILSDFTNQNFPEAVTQKAIDMMVYRGEAQLSSNKKFIIRLH